MSVLPWALMAGLSAGLGNMNPLPAPSDVGYREIPRHHFRGQYENDSAFSHDRNYTHGTRFDYAYSMDKEHSLSESDAWGLSLQQLIYTPEIHTRGAVPQQHPYAGYLAFGAAYMQRWVNFGQSAELQIGCTGKPSFAENSQWFIHNLCNMEQWDGWHDQVPAELTFQLGLRQDYRLPFAERCFSNGWQTDGMAFTRENVGTVAINGGAGFCFRLGKNLPDSMQVNGINAGDFAIGLLRKLDYRRKELSYFLALEGYVGFYARDITVDGGVFHHFDQTCSRTPWQAEGRLGVGVSYEGIDYYAGAVLHSRAYRTQDENSLYGTFSISLHW